MYCNECGRTNGHIPGCPNYTPPNDKYYCSVCEEGIQNGEEYIVNDVGDYAHWDCFNHGRDLAEFLGCSVLIMDDEKDDDDD